MSVQAATSSSRFSFSSSCSTLSREREDVGASAVVVWADGAAGTAESDRSVEVEDSAEGVAGLEAASEALAVDEAAAAAAEQGGNLCA
jgi:hypothetical protein